MPTYNFKKELKLYVVKDNVKYDLDIYPDITFSQTFNETSVPVKTLHAQFDMFEQASITKANPANFNFTVPISRDREFGLILDLLLNYDNSTEAILQAPDYYVEMNTGIYKLEMAVIESAVFQISRNQILTLTCSGSARKLVKNVTSIPGAFAAKTASRSFTSPNALEIRINDIVKTSIMSVSLELTNNVEWVDFSTLQDSLNVTASETSMFPEAFVVSSRVLSGNIQQYVTDETEDAAQTWEIGSTLEIRTGATSDTYLIAVEIPEVVFTNRLDLQEMLMQTYDFRMISAPSDISTLIQLVQLAGILGNYTIWAAF